MFSQNKHGKQILPSDFMEAVVINLFLPCALPYISFLCSHTSLNLGNQTCPFSYVSLLFLSLR